MRWGIAALGVMLLVGACFGPDRDAGSAPTFRNDSGVAVEIYSGDDAQPFLRLDPGQSALFPEVPDFRLGCTRSPLVARDASGEPVDRRDDPLCAAETWVIDGRDG